MHDDTTFNIPKGLPGSLGRNIAKVYYNTIIVVVVSIIQGRNILDVKANN